MSRVAALLPSAGAVVLLLLAAMVSARGVLEQTGNGYAPCDANVSQWSGYFHINGTSGSYTKNYFYWAFGPRSGRANAPVLLWMTGGPGCSSSLALLVENGPCHVNEKTAELYNNPYGWNSDAFLVYVDQPSGVGFSYGGANSYDSNEAEVSRDMYWFIQSLLEAHPTWQSNDFFIVGESYGGHFAPATAYRVLQGNLNHDGPVQVKLTGLGIGNGLTDPYIQYASYPDLAYNWCNTVLGHPCVSESTYESMLSTIPSCQALIAGCMQNNSIDCDFAASTCNSLLSDYEMTGLNVYDIRKPCDGELCYNFNGAIKFMNEPAVQKALGAKSTSWQPCSSVVNQMFTQDWFKDFNYTVPALLASGVRVLVYNGDDDFICNWIGSKNWTTAMQWPQQAQFDRAADKPVMLNNTQVALVRSVSSASSPILFSFMQVHGAGHMVPMDQPATALYMIHQFMSNQNFVA